MTREVFTGFVVEESVRRRDAGSPQIRASGGVRGAPQGADGPGGGGRWQRSWQSARSSPRRKKWPGDTAAGPAGP